MKASVWLRKKFISFIAILLITQSFLLSVQAQDKEVQVSAQAAILLDAETGRILFEKNSNESLRIASITKIMTAIVAIENGELDGMVKTSKNAYRVEGSTIYLKLGEKLSLEDMIYGLMLRSGNDAAVAIAEHIGGSLEGFVLMMNQKAEELGMTRTFFSNPHGLDTHEEHYSSARDMAILTAYAMKNETFATIVGTKRKTAPLEGESWDRIWHNKNRLLTKYPYADGVKTGYTKRAKRTLVSSATKDGNRLIAVTLNAADDWNDHIHMFEYGFKHYTQVTLVEKEEQIRDERLAREDGRFQSTLQLTYPLKQSEQIHKKIVIHPAFSQKKLADIPYPAGYIQFSLADKEIGRVPLEFIQQKKENSFWMNFKKHFKMMLGGS